ncbi:hypothetical protein DYB35_012706, partial [Aphanomyces astaci]
VFRLAEPLGLLFPSQFTAWMRLLASFLAPDTLDLVTHVAGLERPLATYTQHLSVEQHTTAAGDVITCDKVIRTPDMDIPVSTTGQVVPLVCLDGSPTTLVCWHIEGTSLLTLWDVVWTRLKDATCDSVMAAAALHWLATYGRVAPARFDAVWRRWSTRGEAADVLTRHLASACGTTAAAALGVVAVLDPASLVADDDVIAAAMHAVVVSSHESSSVGVLACLQCWLRRLPAAPSVFVPLLLQLLLHHPPPRRVARVAAFRLVAQALVQSKVPFLLDLTLLSHGQSLLFDAATTLLQHPVETSSATTKEERGHFASFNRPTPAACPVLPYAFTDTSEVDVALVEAALHAVRLVLASHPPGIETPHPETTSSFAAYGRESLNWPVACAAYLTCPSSSVRLVAAQVLAAVARHLPDSTSLMACIRTSDDATAFLTSLLAIVRHDAPRLQVAVWTLWTQCLDAQPSVLSLLFERPEAPSAIVDAVRGAHDGGQHVVVGAAVGFLLAIWDGLSRSNACHHLASLFRATPLFWATLTQPLGTSPPPPSSSSPLPHAAATYAHGAIFKLLAIEYHVERQATTTVAGASSLHEILSSFRDLYDRWFHEYTSVTPAAAAMDEADVPAYVLAADVPPPLFALAQWTTFMEIYFLHPSTTSSSSASSVATVPVSSPSASAGSRSRLTCDSPMLPARAAESRPSNFSGDRTSLAWSLKLTERMAALVSQGDAVGLRGMLPILSRLCLCMIHHQVCEVTHKANDPRWSTTHLRLPSRQQLDPVTSVHLLTLVHSILHVDTTNLSLWTASLLLLRQLAPQPLPSLLVARVVSHCVHVITNSSYKQQDQDSRFATASLVLVIVLDQHVSADSTLQLVAILDHGPLVPALVETAAAGLPSSSINNKNPTTECRRRTDALRCLVGLVTAHADVRAPVLAALARLDFLHRASVLATYLTADRPTIQRDGPTQTAWCLLLQIVTALLQNDVVAYVAFVANVASVLLAALYSTDDLTVALLTERHVTVQLVHASARHMRSWQAVMPG